ncbi:MAG: AAA family ATPase [Planctomycetales bacterium]|nr:AAA family ATPase [Planctomycetales bacterium]
MTYWRYWQLDSAPYSLPAGNSWLHRGPTVEEAIARIEFLITNRRSLGTLLGEEGSGKSSLLRYVHRRPPNSIDVPCLQTIFISMMGLTGGELFVDLANQLTGTRRSLYPTSWADRLTTTNSYSAWSTLCDYFQAARRQDLHTVLLIDDTEASGAAAESDLLRILSGNFPATIILSINSRLLSSVSRSILTHTDLQIELPAWDLVQTTDFIARSCERLGRVEPIFTDRASERVYQLSMGFPKHIIRLVDLALVAGAVCQSNAIDVELIEQVAQELPFQNVA